MNVLCATGSGGWNGGGGSTGGGGVGGPLPIDSGDVFISPSRK